MKSLTSYSSVLLFAIASSLYIYTFYFTFNYIVSPMHLDGAFQTASGLFRMSDGQIAGRDFYPYIGTGVIYSIYPIFVLFGSTLFASQMASTIMCGISVFITLFAMVLLISKEKRFLWATFFALLAPFMLVFISTNSTFLDSVLPSVKLSVFEITLFQMFPGNSLRPIRRILPFIIGILFIVFFLKTNGFKRPILMGFTLGLASVWSNDTAIPTVMAFGAAGLYLFVSAKKYKECGYFVLSTFLASIIILTIATGGNPISLLKYNFIDVAKNQFWYFAPYARETRILSLTDLWKMIFTEPPIFMLLSIPISLALFIKERNVYNTVLVAICASSFGGWLLPSIGGHTGEYYGGFMFFSMCLFYALIIRAVEEHTKNVPNKVRYAMVASLSVLSVLIAYLSVVRYHTFKTNISQNESFFKSNGYSAMLHTDFSDMYNHIKEKKEYPMEEYWGLTGAKMRKFSNLKVDSIIHAMGTQREKFENYLKEEKPKVVITTNPMLSEGWTLWNLNMNWWFYRNLFLHYTPTIASPTIVEWTLSEEENNWTDVAVKVEDGKAFVYVEQPGLYEIEIEVDNSDIGVRNYFLVKSNMEYTSERSTGETPLDPNARTHVFPFLSAENGWNEIEVKNMRNNSKANIESISAKKITPDYEWIYYYFKEPKEWIQNRIKFMKEAHEKNESKYIILEK